MNKCYTEMIFNVKQKLLDFTSPPNRIVIMNHTFENVEDWKICSKCGLILSKRGKPYYPKFLKRR